MMKFYEINSNPLKEITIEELTPGKSYVTEEGVKYKYQIDGSMQWEQCSPLTKGELITNLSKKLLDLFWTLLKNVKVYDTSNTGE